MDRPHHLGQPVVDVLLPPTGRGPGVLVMHPWWGLNKTIRDYGAALAKEGFVVGLADIFAGETTTKIEDAEKLIRKYWEAAGPKAAAAFAELAKHPAVTTKALGAVGFSFGGFHLLASLGGKLPIGAAVIYYATYPDARLDAAPVMAHFAEHDDFESDADRDALLAKLPKDRGFIYTGTAHWFAEADRPEYRAEAAQLAFERSVEFLWATIG
ncbi:MAG: dienelactone hydrolase family protein [Devosia sp.]